MACRFWVAVVGCVGGFGATASAVAGPIWDEAVNGGMDAGSTPIAAQDTTSVPFLRGIRGRLQGNLRSGPGDFEDMYLVSIPDVVDDPVFNYLTFCARTYTVLPDSDGILGSAAFDSQLWLFRAGGVVDGFGVLGNDDSPAAVTTGSLLMAPDDDNLFPTLPGPGLYYLAISASDNDPLSAGGAIFSQGSSTEISGPDGPGGGSPIIGWTGPTDPAAVGTYLIEFCPEPTTCFTLMAGGLAVLRRRRV